MHDREPFEARLHSALDRYADQVSTEVDALAFVRATRPAPAHSLLPWRRTSTLRLALLLGLLLALAIAAAALVGALPSPRVYQGVFTPTASMGVGRVGHAAILLQDGNVLLVGSARPMGGVGSAERYDPAADRFSATGGMTAVRRSYAITRLSDGRVLIVGGYVGAADHAQATAEIYDPAIGTFALSGSMATGRDAPTATLLLNGVVLVVGGECGCQLLSPFFATAELYDPATGAFAATGSMSEPRSESTATLLRDGRVLIAGGTGGSADLAGTQLASAELYDPATGTFSPTGTMREPRVGATATLLQDGRVLFIGGYYGSGDQASAELYDPETGMFTLTGPMSEPRDGAAAVLLQDGHVLVTGGYSAIGGNLATAELYDPTTGSFAATGSMSEPRSGHTATLLQDGTVLIAGGGANQLRGLATSERYR